jgi:hypothetical protein
VTLAAHTRAVQASYGRAIGFSSYSRRCGGG